LQNADPVMTSILNHGVCVRARALNHRSQCPNSYMRLTIATWCLFNNEENSSWWLYVDAGVTFQDNLRIVGPYLNDRMIKANEQNCQYERRNRLMKIRRGIDVHIYVNLHFMCKDYGF